MVGLKLDRIELVAALIQLLSEARDRWQVSAVEHNILAAFQSNTGHRRGFKEYRHELRAHGPLTGPR
jgi:hypothetical protein